MKAAYSIGRGLQLAALVALPPAIWVGQFGHSMMGEVVILVGAIGVFAIGTLLARSSSR